MESIVADMNATAVWPEGRLFMSLASGRGISVMCFMPFTMPAMIIPDAAHPPIIPVYELRLSMPAAFMDSIRAAGANCI